MKKLRELLAKAVPGEWHYDGMHDEITSNQAKHYWVATDICIDEVCEREYDQFGHSYSPTLDLICAMHNHLPELLDAWETLEALRWANDLRMNGTCDLCPFYGDDVNVWKRGCNRQCRALFEYEGEWLSTYREAQKNEGVE